MTPEITAFFHEPTNTVCYLVADPETNACAVIDSVLDYDADAARTGTEHADAIVAHPRARADARTGSSRPMCMPTTCRPRPSCATALGGRIGIGARITTVQHTFAEIYNAERGFAPRRLAVRPAVRGRRAVRDRRARGRVPGDAGPHAGLRQLQGRRRHLRRRHAVHARLRHRALRLPRRRRADDVPLDPPHPRPPAADGALDVPRLQGAGTRRVRLAHHGRRRARAEPAGPRRHRARTSSSRCARRGTRPSARRSC